MNTATTQRLAHICHECGKCDYWGETWRWYGSWKDLDDGTVKKFCSEQCATAWAKRENVSLPPLVYD